VLAVEPAVAVDALALVRGRPWLHTHTAVSTRLALTLVHVDLTVEACVARTAHARKVSARALQTLGAVLAQHATAHSATHVHVQLADASPVPVRTRAGEVTLARSTRTRASVSTRRAARRSTRVLRHLAPITHVLLRAYALEGMVVVTAVVYVEFEARALVLTRVLVVTDVDFL
jgi:hypothetical protein